MAASISVMSASCRRGVAEAAWMAAAKCRVLSSEPLKLSWLSGA